MSGVASTDAPVTWVSATVEAAARGDLPSWSRVTAARREHVARVSALTGEWADVLDLSPVDRTRWRAAGTLHDALRDASEPELRSVLGRRFTDLHPALLHGPAAALCLSGEADEALLMAIRYHTLGHPELDRLGRALYLADFLEPARDFAREWRESLRSRMPAHLDEVLREVVAARIQHLLVERKPLRPETAAFWTALTEEA